MQRIAIQRQLPTGSPGIVGQGVTFGLLHRQSGSQHRARQDQQHIERQAKGAGSEGHGGGDGSESAGTLARGSAENAG
ncbi:hypothetical protein QN375_02045 [Pseudomonas sp. MH9.2]|uniref:hypothetical protein n=1 Tax=Pseudomonas sp. MH9.2 TaxID=3048629 RepID=UPI002AC98267|nr:hypothetical protein [Pseudomonas sp. MH9.2]MEB0024578.1 hypothetical protein [Pseudomonas sp. MH9.2]WPX71658.1 hypothetical protein RHM55_10000 [Pseudomonas sp. MH9.2]